MPKDVTLSPVSASVLPGPCLANVVFGPSAADWMKCEVLSIDAQDNDVTGGCLAIGDTVEEVDDVAMTHSQLQAYLRKRAKLAPRERIRLTISRTPESVLAAKAEGLAATLQSLPLPSSETSALPSTEEALRDAGQSAEFVSINAAIAAAPLEGKTGIVLRGGIYHEQIVIDRSVVLKAAAGEKVVLICDNERHTIISWATSAALIGITLRHETPRREQFPQERLSCVEVTSGNLRLEKCDIQSLHGTGICVVGPDAVPTFIECSISGCARQGIHIMDAAKGRVVDCVISKNGRAGVDISGGADPVIQNCVITKGRGPGIVVRQDGLGSVRCCEIASNAYSGIEIKQGADPFVEENKIHHQGMCGIFVFENGRGSVRACDIHHNSLANVAISSGGNPLVQSCEVHHGAQSGIHIYKAGIGTVLENNIFENTLSNIIVSEGSTPLIESCTVHGGREDGISFVDGGNGEARMNDIYGNAFAGIAVGDGSNPKVTGNRVHHGRQSGVYCYSRGVGTFQDNEIFANCLSNVEVASGATPILIANTITDGEQAGIFFHDGGGGTLRLNQICRNKDSGVTVRDAASAPVIERNSIEDNGNVGVRIYGGGGELTRNRVVGNARSGLIVEEHSRTKISRNVIACNRVCEVLVKRKVGMACFDGNRILLRDSDFSSLIVTMAATDRDASTALERDYSAKVHAGIVGEGISVRCDDLALADALRLESKNLADHDDLAEMLTLVRELFRADRATLVWTMDRRNLASASPLRPTTPLPLVLGNLFGILDDDAFVNVAQFV